MDLPSDLASRLRDLVQSIGSGDETLTNSLSALSSLLETAVSCYLGFRLTLVLDGWPITLTAFSVDEGARAATSLRLNLAGQGPGFDPDSEIVFYAGTPGAFVDLAADIEYLLRQGQPVDGDGHRPAVALDTDLPPVDVVSGLAGLAEYATINRAMGLLVGRGQDPDQARATLRRDATSSGLDLHHYAAQLLNS